MNIFKFHPTVIFCALFFAAGVFPLNAQGWERTYSLASSGHHIFMEQNGGFLIADNGFLFTDPDGELINGWGNSLVETRALIETADGNMAGAGWNFSLSKFSKTGTIEWSNENGLSNEFAHDVKEDSDGNFIMTGSKNFSFNHLLIYMKVDAAGNKLWQKEWLGSAWPSSSSIALAPDGGFWVAAHAFAADEVLLRFDADGNLLNTLPAGCSYVTKMEPHPDGGYVLFGGEQDTTATNTSYDLCLIRLNEDGSQVWKKNYHNSSVEFYGDWPVDFERTSDGGYALVANSALPVSNDIWLVKTDADGNLEWSRTFGGNHCDEARDMLQTPDGGYAIIGHSDMQIPDIQCEIYDMYLIRTDSLGNTLPFVVEGHVRFDTDDDCVNNPADEGLQQWVLSIENGTDTLYRVTDFDGHYYLSLDTGIYEIKVLPPNAVWEVCVDSVVVDLDGSVDTAQADFSVRSDYHCPYLELDIDLSNLKPCQLAFIHGTVFNYGSTVAEDAFVEITVDTHLTVISSSPPFSSQSGNVYTIELGDIDFNTGTFFNMILDVPCDSTIAGETYCVEAHVHPDTTCIPFDPSWSGADLVASAYCDEDDGTVHFEIENVGSGNMDEALPFIVIEDDAIMMPGTFELEAGQKYTHPPIVSNGAFLRVEADQEPFHPSHSDFITAFVEGCGTNPSGGISLGFVNQYPLADADPYLDQECREVLAAFDPNIKMAYSEGFGENHIIERGDDLEYVVHFQNTGTDVAYNVTVRDTLSPYLDPATVRPGASSHDYNFEILAGNVLKFSFPNILLPDSTANEPASHGFVSFKISQKPGLGDGTEIYNSAAIYFDIFAPVITNETYHTIGEKFIQVTFNEEVTSEELNVKVYPNPFAHVAIFEIETELTGNFELKVYDTLGRLIGTQVQPSAKFEFDGSSLRAGNYFFLLTLPDGNAMNGKIQVQ